MKDGLPTQSIYLIESAQHTSDGAIIHCWANGDHRVVDARGDIARLNCGGTLSSLFIEGHAPTGSLHSSLFGIPLGPLDYQEAGLIDCTV